MKIINCTDYQDLSRKASGDILASIREYPSQYMCTATGQSCLGLYKELASEAARESSAFNRLGIVKLDEWVGLGATDASSCEAYLRAHVLGPLQIPQERYIGFDSTLDSEEDACEQVDRRLETVGPIGCCILGLGVNGHVGFNEPGDELIAPSHKAVLSPTSKKHKMLQGKGAQPEFGLTLGMRAIMQSRKVILLLTGKGKQAVIEQLMEGKISTRLPASFLWMHPDVTCFRDMESTT